jgi:DNA-binding transcriptional ArsR family regulator
MTPYILDLSNLEVINVMASAKAVAPLDLAAMEIHAEDAARLLRSLGNPHRLLVLCLLADGEMSVGALNESLPLSQSALSQHLAVLREEGLVTTRRDGQAIYYRVPAGPALKILEVLHENFCAIPVVAKISVSKIAASKNTASASRKRSKS